MDSKEEGEEVSIVERCVLRKNGAKYKPYSAVSDGSEMEPDASENELPVVAGVLKTAEPGPRPDGHAKDDSGQVGVTFLYFFCPERVGASFIIIFYFTFI